MQTRISARLDAEHIAKLDVIRRVEEVSTTEVVKRSIDIYYKQIKAKRRRTGKLLAESGLIGCGDGPEDLSTRYKSILAELLEAKHADR